MELFYLILILFIAFVPAAFAVLYTKQSKKRGCGRGCERCGNRDFCHRRSLNMGKASEKTDGTDGT
ncbi:MAG TPA: FeoB-associated Cys-rich membrane protein [Candidatus Limivicinus faecipullorum]|nr:FeoB-associated Cys-rich membrane protein [Candidatus Limivicinus faecipullorum]